MSVQRDYILRLIEQFGQFWAAVVAQSRAGQHREVLALAERARREVFGFDTALLDRASADELSGMLRLRHAPQFGDSWLTEQLTLLGLMLRAEAEGYRGLGDGVRVADREQKAVAISLAALDDDLAASPQAIETIEALVPNLKEHVLSPDLAAQLWRYDERSGNLARAEDWLFALLEDADSAADLAPEALAFYDRLQALDDDALRRGNLPRDEVATGQAETVSRLAQREAGE